MCRWALTITPKLVNPPETWGFVNLDPFSANSHLSLVILKHSNLWKVQNVCKAPCTFTPTVWKVATPSIARKKFKTPNLDKKVENARRNSLGKDFNCLSCYVNTRNLDPRASDLRKNVTLWNHRKISYFQGADIFVAESIQDACRRCQTDFFEKRLKFGAKCVKIWGGTVRKGRPWKEAARIRSCMLFRILCTLPDNFKGKNQFRCICIFDLNHPTLWNIN